MTRAAAAACLAWSLAACSSVAGAGDAGFADAGDAAATDGAADAAFVDAGGGPLPPDFGFARELASPLSFLLQANGHLFRIDPRSNRPRLLLDEPLRGGSEVLHSKAANRVLFSTDDAVYAVDLADFAVREISDARDSLSWSPDGAHLVFRSGRDDTYLHAFAEARSTVLWTSGQAQALGWSPRGRYLVVSRSWPEVAFAVVDTTSGAHRVIAQEAIHEYLVAPDDSRIAWIARAGPSGTARLFVHALDAGTTRELSDFGDGPLRLEAFSADAGALYVALGSPGGNASVTRIGVADGATDSVFDGEILEVAANGRWAVARDAVGFALVELADFRVAQRLALEAEPSSSFSAIGFAFSDDGRYLAYSTPLTRIDLESGASTVVYAGEIAEFRWVDDRLLGFVSAERFVDEALAVDGQLFLSWVDEQATAVQVGLREEADPYELRLRGVAPDGRALCEHRRIRHASRAEQDATEEVLVLWTAQASGSPTAFEGSELMRGAPYSLLHCVFPR